MNALVKIALAVAGVVALAIVALVLLRGGGEEAAIEAMLRQAVEEARAGETEKCIGYVARDYAFEGLGYDDVCRQIRRYVKPGQWSRIDIENLEVGVEGEAAVVSMQLSVAGDDSLGRPMPLRLNLQLKKGDGTWKVAGYRVEDRR